LKTRSRPGYEKPAYEKLNSRFTLKRPLTKGPIPRKKFKKMRIGGVENLSFFD
jgi:hypothetical protein